MSRTQIVVIDFETLGTDIATAPLLALGVVIGDTKGKIQSEYEFVFNLPNQLKTVDKQIDEKTLHWWSNSKRASLFSDYMYKCSISQCLKDRTFSQIHSFFMSEINWSYNTILAAYHDSFDTGLLKQMYRDYTIVAKYPFSYRSEFDLASLSRVVKASPKYKKLEFVGTKHNALDDARNEYTRMIYQLEFLGIQL